MNVKIQGTIVSPDYDDEIFAAWIDRGVITPSSRVVSALENAKEKVDLYINSYGGDVFAGGEMMIALKKCAASGRLASVEVGSIAASMAANIVASLRADGVPVTAHANSQLMFHGCYTTTEGGAQHHEDVAASLRNINDSVIADLKRCGVAECRAWFAEGREKWIGADEGKSLNLFSTIAEDDAEAPAEAKHTATRLAAFASTIASRMEYQMKVDETLKPEEPKTEVVAPAAKTAPEAPAPAAPEAPNAPVAAVPPRTAGDSENNPEAIATAQAPAPADGAQPRAAEDVEAKLAAVRAEMKAKTDARVAGIQATLNKQISELTKERDDVTARLDEANAAIKAKDVALTSAQADIEKLEADLAATRDQLAQSEHNRESVVTSALAPAAKTYACNRDRIASGMRIVTK